VTSGVGGVVGGGGRRPGWSVGPIGPIAPVTASSPFHRFQKPNSFRPNGPTDQQTNGPPPGRSRRRWEPGLGVQKQAESRVVGNLGNRQRDQAGTRRRGSPIRTRSEFGTFAECTSTACHLGTAAAGLQRLREATKRACFGAETGCRAAKRARSPSSGALASPKAPGVSGVLNRPRQPGPSLVLRVVAAGARRRADPAMPARTWTVGAGSLTITQVTKPLLYR
jgi:hypothetical protein